MDKVCKALKMHMNSAEVAEAASAALLSLTLNGKLNPQTYSYSNPYPSKLIKPTAQYLLLCKTIFLIQNDKTIPHSKW